jgi:hypothetical protein
MWGNRRGWMIALAIVATAACGSALFLHHAGTPTPATSFARDPSNLAVIQLPITPEVVLHRDELADHTQAYARCLELYKQNPDLYDRFAATGTPDDPQAASLSAVQTILRIRTLGQAKIFADRPQTLINYDRSHPDLDACRTLGTIAIVRLGLLKQRGGDLAGARRCYEAGFALGHALLAERLTYDELEAGLSMMGQASPALATLLEKSGDLARAEKIRAFDLARAQYVRERITPMLRVSRSVDGPTITEHAGDLQAIISDSREHTWRIEAILALGRMRYFTGDPPSPANRRAALRKLRMLSSDGDTATNTAARAALALTPEQYRGQ